MNKVVCRVKRMGGGFGGKESRNIPISLVVAIAAAKVNKPVRLMLDRDDDMVVTGTRYSVCFFVINHMQYYKLLQ